MHQMFLNHLNKFIYLLILFSCASVKVPPGGPIDSIPPKLESTNPKILTGLKNNQKITLSFNEFIKEESIKNAIEIFPSIDDKIDYEYQGKDIIITLPSNLSENKTYVLSLNSNFSDEQNVKLKNNIIIPISLSDIMDSGTINGNIFGSFKQPSILLWKGEIDNDKMINQKPDYVLSSSNNFNFNYMPFGVYTILAVDLYNKRLPLNENKVSFYNQRFIEVKNENVLNINFYFRETAIIDSLEVEEENLEAVATLVGNLKGNFILPLILELKDSDNSFKTELSIDGTFRIDNIQSGSYQLLAYQDRNNNKILDTGTFNNEKLSEKFYVYPDSLSLRSNWELEIQNWVIN